MIAYDKYNSSHTTDQEERMKVKKKREENFLSK